MVAVERQRAADVQWPRDLNVSWGPTKTIGASSRYVGALDFAEGQGLRSMSEAEGFAVKSVQVRLTNNPQIKCIMDDSGPPCKRCAERNLSCVLNKSLQTLIEERSQ